MPLKKDKLKLNLLIEMKLPSAMARIMSNEDLKWLMDICTVRINTNEEDLLYVFHLEDIYKVRNLFSKYETILAFPASAQIRKYGLKYSSGDTLDIKAQGDAFVCTQFMPDGRVETKIIPKDICWRVFYTLKDYFERNPIVPSLQSPVVWELLCREFKLDRYFDRSGTFHKNSFFGDRKQYFYFAYYPLKILDHIRKISYSGTTISIPAKEVKEAPQ